MSTGSLKAIFYALGANFAIAVCKAGAAAFTGSGSMLAEAIHSLADCMNQLLLLLGMRQAANPPTELNPLGQGRVAYFYSLIVALLLFFMGGAFSVYQGIERLLHGEHVENPVVALVVLGVSLLLELFSLSGAIREIHNHSGRRLSWRWFRETRQSELLVVVGEDTAALAGLAVAFVAVLTTMLTGNPVYDACGSIGVGLLLMLVAALVLREIQSMIIGESAEPEIRRAIHQHLLTRPEIVDVISLITLQWGSHIVIAVQAHMIDYPSGRAQIDAINAIEEDLQQTFANARWVFFEPDVPRAMRGGASETAEDKAVGRSLA